MGTVTIKFSSEQEQTLLERMKAAGETNKSKHIRRVYFENEGVSESLLGGISNQLNHLLDAAQRNQNILSTMVNISADPVGLSLTSALYLMLHKSVTADVRRMADKYVDVATVESFLNKS